MTNVVKIVAAILDNHELMLYDETGNTHIIRQGDPRLAGLVSIIIPEIRAKGSVLVDLTFEVSNTYADYEEQSGGFVRFFKVAKRTLSGIFGRRQELAQPAMMVMAAGTPPTKEQPLAIPVMAISDQQVVDEIIKNAKPAKDPDFAQNITPTKDVESEEGSTLVAITKDNKVIPNIQNMEKHIKHALDTESVGMKNFIKRVSEMTQKRQHSMNDLLQFMQHGDLPVADDGSIIIYKLLFYARDSKTQYVDAHTRKVTQRIGSRVFMSESLVDANRNADCSDGLHVAQRNYLNSFNGNVCVLARVRPEDVIAVPRHATNKMRVCAYEILAELSQEAYNKVKANQKFTDSSPDQALLVKAIRNEFPEYDQCVEITQNNGNGVKVYPRPLTKAEAIFVPEVLTAPEAIQALPDVLEKGQSMNAPVVTPKAVQAEIESDKTVTPPSRAQVAQGLWKEFKKAKGKQNISIAAQALIDYKKKAKVSWFNLGFEESPEETLKAAIKP